RHYLSFLEDRTPRDLLSFPTRRSSDLTPEGGPRGRHALVLQPTNTESPPPHAPDRPRHRNHRPGMEEGQPRGRDRLRGAGRAPADRKSTRLNSSHVKISYAVFCLKKKK